MASHQLHQVTRLTIQAPKDRKVDKAPLLICEPQIVMTQVRRLDSIETSSVASKLDMISALVVPESRP